MSAITELQKNAASCRLVEQPLVDEFNDLAAVFRRVRQELPQLVQDQQILERFEAMVESKDRKTLTMKRVRDKLAQTHYRIGFIGKSQIGKSTTFNNVLGLNERVIGKERYLREAPASEGSGGAKTASITRLRAGNTTSCVVQYFHPDELERRLSEILEKLVDVDSKLSPAEMIAEVRRKIEADSELKEPAPGDFTSPDAKTWFSNDLVRGLKFLQSYDEKRAGLPQNRSYKADYLERGNYVNHQPGQPVSDRWLQHYIEIEFPTKAISDELEMVDLPGLGVNKWDDLTTRDFLPSLDAALVFNVCSANVDEEEFKNNVRRLKEAFNGEVEDRIWVVAFHIEQPGDRKILGDYKANGERGETLLDHLDGAIRGKGIPLKQVLVLSNFWFEENLKLADSKQALDDEGYPICEISPSTFVPKWTEFSVAGHGKLQAPKAWDRHPQLRDAFLAAMGDSGIPRLRTLMRDQIANLVKARIERQAGNDLVKLRQQLRNFLDGIASRLQLSTAERENAGYCATNLTTLASELRWKSDYYRSECVSAINEIRSRFDKHCPANFSEEEPLHKNHERWVRRLSDGLREILRTKTFPNIQEKVTATLRAGAAGLLPAGFLLPVAHPGGEQRLDLIAAWNELCRQDLDSGRLDDEALAQFGVSELFTPHNNYRTFSRIAYYRDHMHRRLEAFVYSAIAAYSLVMRKRLAELANYLHVVSDGDQGDGAAGAGTNPASGGMDAKAMVDRLLKAAAGDTAAALG